MLTAFHRHSANGRQRSKRDRATRSLKRFTPQRSRQFAGARGSSLQFIRASSAPLIGVTSGKVLRQHRDVFLGALLMLCAFVVSSFSTSIASAQSLAQPLVYLQQSHWTQKQGLRASTIQNLRRTPDGYLWIGSTSGLIRFDGFRFTVIDRSTYAPTGSRAPTIYAERDAAHAVPARQSGIGMVSPMLVDRDGVLWIGDADGSVIRYRNGKFTRAIEPDSTVGRINSLVQDRAGRYWAVGSIGDRLYALQNSRLIAAPVPSSLSSQRVRGVVVDTGDGVWIGTHGAGLWHVTSTGPAEHFSVPEHSGDAVPMIQSRDGAVWVWSRNTYRFSNGVWQAVVVDAENQLIPNDAVEMPDSAVVLTTRGGGLVRWKAGYIDRLRESDGLSSESAHRLLLDGDGSLWATTDGGLDRFRAAPFITIGTRNGLPTSSTASIQLDGDGDLWVMSGAGSGVLQKFDRTQLLLHRDALRGHAGEAQIDSFYAPFARLPGHGVILVDNFARFVRVDGGRIKPLGIAGVPQVWENRPTNTLTTRNGDIWFSFLRRGFGRARDGRYQPMAPSGLENRAVSAMAEDSAGHVWVAMADTALILELDGDRVARTLGVADGIAEPMLQIAVGTSGTLWGAGANSGRVFRIKNGSARSFAFPIFANVMTGANAVLVPQRNQIWFASGNGIGRLDCALLETDTANAVKLFDATDGLTAGRLGRMLFGGAVTDPEGRIWFSTLGGLAVVSPASLRKNEAPPNVLVEEVRSAGNSLWHADTNELRVAPNPARLDITFTATALLVPERVRIEYRLIGADTAWIDGSATRTATYTNLSPGAYDFHVRAWNEDGVPSTRDATIHLSVLPAWYQTLWFRALAVLLFVGVVSVGAAAQQKRKARAREDLLRSRFEATLEERARLAREMHDTLLSGFTGVTYQLHALQQSIVPTPERAASRLTDIMNSADEVIRDARRTIWDIRNHDADTDNLVANIERAARGAVEDTDIVVQLNVQGERRALGAAVDTVILRIAREAVVNAVKHARPQTIVVDLIYKTGRVALRVHDDGCGFTPVNIDGAAATGHLGIKGMIERAKALGGSVTIDSGNGDGTSVVLELHC